MKVSLVELKIFRSEKIIATKLDDLSIYEIIVDQRNTSNGTKNVKMYTNKNLVIRTIWKSIRINNRKRKQ